MPTHNEEESFQRDWAALSRDQQRLFAKAVQKMVADLKAQRGFRNGLRVKGIRRLPGVYEMTWADDGRTA